MMNMGVERSCGNDCLDSGYDDDYSKATDVYASDTAAAMPLNRFSGLGLGYHGITCQVSPQFGDFTNRACHSMFESSFNSDSNYSSSNCNSNSYSYGRKSISNSSSISCINRSNILNNSNKYKSFNSLSNHNDSSNTTSFPCSSSGAVDGQPPRLSWSRKSRCSSRKETGGLIAAASASAVVVVATMEPWWDQVTFEPDYFQTGKPIYSRTNLGANIANENHKYSVSHSHSHSHSACSDSINSYDIESHHTSNSSDCNSYRLRYVREGETSDSDCNRSMISGSFEMSSSKRPYSPSTVSFSSSDGVHASGCPNKSLAHISSSSFSETALFFHHASKRSKIQLEVEPSNSDDFGFYNNSCDISNCSSSEINSGSSICNSGMSSNCDGNGSMCLHSVKGKNDTSEDSYPGVNLYPSASTYVSIKLLNGRHFNLDVAGQDLSVTFLKNILVERFGYDPGSYVLCSNGILSDDSDIKQLCTRSFTRLQANSLTSDSADSGGGCGSQSVVEMKCVSRIKN